MPLRHIYSAASATAASAIRVILTRQFPDILIRRRQLDCEEMQQVAAEEIAEKEEDSVIPGQIDLIAFLPPKSVFTSRYAGQEG